MEAESNSSRDGGTSDSSEEWGEIPGVKLDEERVYHFRRLRLSPATLSIFQQNGFTAWTSTRGGGIAETDAKVWDAMGIPIGEQEKLRHGLTLFHQRRSQYDKICNLPSGSMRHGLQVPLLACASPLLRLQSLSALVGVRGSSAAAGSASAQQPSAMDDAGSPASRRNDPSDVPANGAVGVDRQAPQAIENSSVSWGAASFLYAFVAFCVGCANAKRRDALHVTAFALSTAMFVGPVKLIYVCARHVKASARSDSTKQLIGGLARAAATTVAGFGAIVSLAVLAECVDGETQIINADRQAIPICMVKEGDVILGWKKNKFITTRVLKVTCQDAPTENVSKLTFDNGVSVVATRNHPFWVHGKEWCSETPQSQQHATQQLQVGDRCVDVNGEAVQVEAIVPMPRGDPTRTVFNLLLDGSGAWFANGLLSHSGMQARRGSDGSGTPCHV